MKAALVQFLGLSTAIVASGVLLATPPAEQKPPPPGPTPLAVAWGSAQRAVIPAQLADGTPYQPAIFLDAKTSVGTAPSRDGKATRLVLRRADASIRQLRSMPTARNPSYQTFTVAGDLLAWVEATRGKNLQIWTMNVRDGSPPRLVTTDTGAAAFYDSQYDLVIADGRLHWVAFGTGDATEVRSVALTGGPVDTRTEAGDWKLSAWPWLVNGVTESVGSTLLRNLSTHQDVSIPRTRRSTTDCSPLWCRVVALSSDGSTRIELMHPDGTGRERIAGGAAATVITDVALLDRFEVLVQTGPNSELTGNSQLLVFDIATRRTIEISPDANGVFYRSGVLSWSTGNQEASVRHSLDLRTV